LKHCRSEAGPSPVLRNADQHDGRELSAWISNLAPLRHEEEPNDDWFSACGREQKRDQNHVPYTQATDDGNSGAVGLAREPLMTLPPCDADTARGQEHEPANVATARRLLLKYRPARRRCRVCEPVNAIRCQTKCHPGRSEKFKRHQSGAGPFDRMIRERLRPPSAAMKQGDNAVGVAKPECTAFY